ncbi:MAG: N,N-diacetylchitobiose transport system permease protein [Gaiellaceae bacterium]|jgi:N,N'-diacetylchitobiose transport system permease protein|nr:N,N-diacetylchitobiose transport system permease protein [Gaiellaceae bacterium]
MSQAMQPEIAPVPVAPAADLGPKRRFYKRGGFRQSLWNALGLSIFLVMIFPVYWMVTSAFKPARSIQKQPPDFIPKDWTLYNFSQAVHCKPGTTGAASGVACQPGFWSAAGNSLIIVASVVGISLVIAFFAAAAVAKFRFFGRRPFIVLMVFIQLVPGIALLLPIYLSFSTTFRGLNLLGHLSGVIVAYIVFSLPFMIWTLRGFIMNIPRDLEEAAMVDGATELGAFIKILLPLVAPGLVATSIFAFISAWNEWIFAATILRGNTQTLMMFLYGLGGGNQGIPWGTIMAASTLISLPAVVFFMLVQRRVAFGLTAGAVRG